MKKLLLFLLSFLQALSIFSQRPDSVVSLTVGKVGDQQIGQKVLLKGMVVNDENGKAIPVAMLLLDEDEKKIETNRYGEFEMELAVGLHRFRVSAWSFEERIFEIQLYAPGVVMMRLLPGIMELDEVVISAESEDENVSNTVVGMERMNMMEIERGAKLMGETDVLRSLQSVSGVSSVGEGASGFNVRGGNTDENLILQDGNLIYNPVHALGFFSLFHPDLVQGIDLYKGGLPAKYGGRLSSVLDVSLREGSTEKFSGKGGIGIASSRLSLEGPLQKDKGSFLIGGRGSYMDWILRQVRQVDLRKSEAFFYDLTAKIDSRVAPNTKIGLEAFAAHDEFQFAEEAKFDYNTRYLSAYVTQLLGKKTSLTFHVSAGQYTSSLFDLQGNDQSKYTNQITYYRARLNALIRPNDYHEINLGTEVELTEISPGELEPLSAESLISYQRLNTERGRSLSVYLEDNISMRDAWNLALGVRYTIFQNYGPGRVFLYQEGIPKLASTLIDSIHFTKNQTLASYSGLEPRVSLRYSISEENSIKAGYNRAYQYVSQVSNTASATPVNIWQMSNYHIKPQYADNFSIGYFHNFNQNAIETSVNLFYRKIYRLIEYKDFARLLVNEHLETELLEGKGRSYGIELLYNKKKGRNQLMLNYTWARSQRQVEATANQEGVNNGRWYSSNFDKPHTLNINYFFIVNPKQNLSVNFTYSTGRPTTAPVSAYSNQNILNIPVYSDRNQFRIPDYHRLDFAYTVEGARNDEKKWKSSWTFSLYNIYGRKNAYSVYFKQSPFQRVTAYRIAVLGTIFPALTYNFNF